MRREIVIQWDKDSIEHISKHSVTDKEVNKAVNGKILMRKISKKGVSLVEILGEVDGRTLFIVLKPHGDRYKVVTARDANDSEKRLYKRRRK
ncbi:MAG: hypothetical protein QMC85_03300 [Methanocellales archaeon]|nr:hypothetical protein [Methanocellales archaeon]MDI6859499.1 hypothetical protein [Methanocellales archaeon]MDI6902532.1 hypothetical protein [Methanocellales archaeon]